MEWEWNWKIGVMLMQSNNAKEYDVCFAVK